MPTACVIFNPAAGRRRAKRRLQRFRARWENDAEFRPTRHPGHAVELARQAADEGYEVIAAAGGDGTAHDVANGLLRSSRDAVFAVVPIGSANDFAHSALRQFGPSELTDSTGHPVDVGLARAPDGRERYFIEGIGLGLAGQVTIESRRIPHLQGVFLYGLAAWRALANTPAAPLLDLAWDDGPSETHPTRMLSLLLGRREGGFVLAPDAALDDGAFEFAHVGRIGRWSALALLPRLALCGPPTTHPAIRLGRCRALRVRSPSPLAAHTDGELFCTPEDDVRDLDITLLPRRLRTKICPAS